MIGQIRLSPIGGGWGDIGQNCDIGNWIRIISSGKQVYTALPGPMCEMLHRYIKWFIRGEFVGSRKNVLDNIVITVV